MQRVVALNLCLSGSCTLILHSPGLAISFPTTKISKDLAKTACHQAVSWDSGSFLPAEHVGEIC